MLSCEFCEILQNTLLTEHVRVIPSEKLQKILYAPFFVVVAAKNKAAFLDNTSVNSKIFNTECPFLTL